MYMCVLGLSLCLENRKSDSMETVNVTIVPVDAF